jgi:hypothetical protein
MFTALSAQGYRTQEPFPIAVEEPRVVRQLVDLHRTELGYDEFDLTKLLFKNDPQFFMPKSSPLLMKVGGEPFFAFLTPRDDGRERGYRFVM